MGETDERRERPPGGEGHGKSSAQAHDAKDEIVRLHSLCSSEHFST